MSGSLRKAREKEMSEANGSVSMTDENASETAECSVIAAISRLTIESKSESGNASAEEIAVTPVSTAGNSTEATTNSGPVETVCTKSAEEVKSAIASAPENKEIPQLSSANEEKCKQNAKDNGTYSSRLEAEVRTRTKERDTYRKKLEEAEAKLAALQTSCTIHEDECNKDVVQQSVEQLRGQLAQTALMYEERNRMVANQENQINALNNQVTSLKEVVSITRDLLEIRNVEVKQLQSEVDNMAKKITEERDRHNTMISKMDAAMRLNADLKKEYETQLALFQSLREKYGEKISLLTREKQAIEETAIPASE